MNIAQHILIFSARAYQFTFSPVLGFLAGSTGGCRFHPTCSHYAVEAVKTHGAIQGSWMGLKRIARCHPWGACGCDPVPPKHIKSLFPNNTPLHGS